MLVAAGIWLGNLGGTPCAQAVESFTAAHAELVTVPIVCEPSGPSGFGAQYDTRAQVIHVYPAGAVDYSAVIAHELGHAWSAGHFSFRTYALVRGFATPDTLAAFLPGNLGLLAEDYAETFAWSIGEWADLGGPSPYAFHTIAGPPTEGQVFWLRLYGVLPR